MLLINPCDYKPYVFVPPLALGYLAGALKKNNFPCKVIDCNIEQDYLNKISLSIKSFDYVGITATIGNIESAVSIAGFIKEKFPDKKIIFGGSQPAAIYNELIPKYCDIVVLSEGEITLIEILQGKALSEIKGIAYNDEGKVVVNQKRDFIVDIDSISFPAWEDFELSKYRPVVKRRGYIKRPFVMFLTSRGCPYDCIFCTKNIHGYRLRLRSVKNIIDEIDHLVNRFGVKAISIADDNFTFYPERTKEICSKIIERGYKDVSFSVFAGIRSDIGDEEMFNLMKKAGFSFVAFGIESGSQKVLDKVNKRLDLSKVHKTISLAKKAGLYTIGFFMFGFVCDDYDSMNETIKFAKSLPLDIAGFHIATPLPGTKYYQQLSSKATFAYKNNFESLNYHKYLIPFELSGYDGKIVKKMHDKAYFEFYSRPKQIWRLLKMKFNHTFGRI
ncbi:MAG: radical SAM protein [Candidatus Gygaella obscura]|nr:radical SAM protein [Candidatus Gygaella obscura]